MAESPEASVIISVLNWNEKEMTIDCIDSIRERTDYPDYQIVVVDNGSDDGSVAAFNERYPDLDIIENETNRGFGPAHNQVLESYSADYFVLFNNDAIPKLGWLTPLVETAKANPDIGIQGPELRFPDGTVHSGGFFGPLGGERRIVDQGEISELSEVDWVSGAVFFISDQVVQDVGTLDEIFAPIYFEEVDYCWQANDYGYRVIYNPRSVVSHDGEEKEDDEESDRVIELMRQHAVTFRALNYPIHWLPGLVVNELTSFAGAIKSSDRSRLVKLYLRAYRGFVGDLPAIVNKRKRRKKRVKEARSPTDEEQ